jgi:hypothetical protein
MLRSLFSEAATDADLQASGLILRLINILCYKAVIVDFGKGEQTIPLACASVLWQMQNQLIKSEALMIGF